MIHMIRSGIVLALCAVALTACVGRSADQGNSDGVVTFQSGPAPGASGAGVTDPDAGRPQLRLDMTDAEQATYYDAYMQCLKDAGVPLERMPNGKLAFTTEEAKEKVDDPAVRKACSGKEPLIPAELDPNRNPYYEENRLAEIQCEIQHGIKWESNGGKYDYPPDVVDPAQLAIQRDCRLHFMTGKRG